MTEADLRKLSPYLTGVVNLEIKEFSNRRNPAREAVLEYADGRKLTGNLSADKFRPHELCGLTSVASYFARGKYGNTNWRGNCSGLLLRDLLLHFRPNFVIDPMAGSGTMGDVCKELNVPHLLLDLNPKYGGFNALRDELPRSADLIFCHPPYFVFPGSSMPQYSGAMWGTQPHPDDGSRIQDPAAFTHWFNQVQANLYQGLRKGGRVCYLVGDSRSKGRYYSMLKEMDIYGDLENIIIKRQFNCVSDSTSYAGRFIPIEHEYLIVIRKNSDFVIACTVVRHCEADTRKSKKITWRNLIQSVLEEHGGQASRDEIFGELEHHPKAEGNQHLRQKLRQVVNTFTNEFVQDGNCVRLAA